MKWFRLVANLLTVGYLGYFTVVHFLGRGPALVTHREMFWVCAVGMSVATRQLTEDLN